MKIAITGGTGFVGRHLARRLVLAGHEVVLIARGKDTRDTSILALPGATFVSSDLSNPAELARALSGCAAVAHCAGINRELGAQTYQGVHIDGTRNVVEAARQAGVSKIALLSFLRARPECGSPYHESKYAAEEIVRSSGLDYTIFKAGVIYGRGDHMLDHLSHALHTFPLFALVGMREKPIRPLAVEDLAAILHASLVDGRLSRKTVAVLGPEELLLGDAVRRVADAVGRHPLIFRMPLVFHRVFAWLAERTMKVPLVSLAQLRILSEGIIEPLPPCDSLPEDLVPATPFSSEQIHHGLPERGGFRLRDCRWFA